MLEDEICGGALAPTNSGEDADRHGHAAPLSVAIIGAPTVFPAGRLRPGATAGILRCRPWENGPWDMVRVKADLIAVEYPRSFLPQGFDRLPPRLFENSP
jgi:hypothetical protein